MVISDTFIIVTSLYNTKALTPTVKDGYKRRNSDDVSRYKL